MRGIAVSEGQVGEVGGWQRRLDQVFDWEPLWAVPAVFLLSMPGGPAWLGWLVILALWPLRLWRRRFRRTPFDLPIGILFASLLVGVYASADPRLSWEAFNSFSGAILLYYLVVNSTSPRHVALFVGLLLAPALLAPFWVFSQGSSPGGKLMDYNRWAFDYAQELVPRLSPYRPHLNGLAGGLDAVLPLLGGLALFTRRPWLRLAAGVGCLVLVGVVMMTGSRGGWLTLAVALLILGAVRHRGVLFAGPAALVLGLAYVSTSVLEREDLLTITSEQTLINRLEVWQAALAMLKNVPFTGVGLGSFPLVYQMYAPPWTPSVVTNPHNAALQLYSDVGLLGAVAALVGMAMWLRFSFRVLAAPRLDPYYGLAVGLVASLTAQLVFGLFESAISGIYLDARGAYHYVASPIYPLLTGLLVSVGLRLLARRPEGNILPESRPEQVEWRQRDETAAVLQPTGRASGR